MWRVRTKTNEPSLLACGSGVPRDGKETKHHVHFKLFRFSNFFSRNSQARQTRHEFSLSPLSWATGGKGASLEAGTRYRSQSCMQLMDPANTQLAPGVSSKCRLRGGRGCLGTCRRGPVKDRKRDPIPRIGPSRRDGLCNDNVTCSYQFNREQRYFFWPRFDAPLKL